MNGITDGGSATGGFARPGGLDDPWTRVPIIGATALAVWFGLLILFGELLCRMVRTSPSPFAIDARVIESPNAATGSIASSAAGAERKVSSAAARPLIAPAPAISDRGLTRGTHDAPQSFHSRAYARHARPSRRSSEPHGVGQKSKPYHEPDAARFPQHYTAVNSTTSSIKGRTKSAAWQASSVNRVMASVPGTAPGEASGDKGALASNAGKGAGAGGSGPRPIYAPVPSIPDDMRDEVMQATAVVRFHVARDGSATVALITRTDFDALNQLILDTLRNWRFQPATRDGAAVDSDAEVHLRITVQ